jgi:hypothetical protein
MRRISWLAAEPVSFSRRTLLHGDIKYGISNHLLNNLSFWRRCYVNVKLKIKLPLCMSQRHMGQRRCSSTHSYLHYYLESMNGFLGRLPYRTQTDADKHWTGSWVCPRSDLDASERRNISSPSPESKHNSWVFKLVVYSLYLLSYFDSRSLKNA